MNSLRLGGSYLLHEPIGRGAMGQVWHGSLVSDGSPVAIKMLRAELAEDADVVARFHREGSIMVAIRHPCVVGIREVVAEGETLAIVMDLIEGGDLRAYLKSAGSLPPAEALRLTGQVLAGLQAVHSAGILHRDLKPENILIDKTGSRGPVARLTDFGIGRFVDGQTQTKATGLIGTPQYLAPEVIENRKATPASDLYSVGIVLYELLTGAVPFRGDHPAAVMRQHLEERPRRPVGLPKDIWELLARLLAKDPDARPASPADVAGRCVDLSRRYSDLLPLPGVGEQDDESPTLPPKASISSDEVGGNLRHGEEALKVVPRSGDVSDLATPDPLPGPERHEKGWLTGSRLWISVIALVVLAAGSYLYVEFNSPSTGEAGGPNGESSQSVIASPDGAIGWWDGSRWREIEGENEGPGNAADVPVRKGDEFFVLHPDGMAVAASATPKGEACGIYPSVELGIPGLDPPADESQADERWWKPSPIAVHGVQNPLPRPVVTVRDVGEDGEASIPYQSEFAEAITRTGESWDQVSVIQVITADLAGDGSQVTLVVVDHYEEDQEEPGYASRALARIASDGVSEVQFMGPETNVTFRIAAVADLNGDDSLEVVLNERYYEGGGMRVYEMSEDNSLVSVLSGGWCGI